jgi:hypothetical protein
MAPNLLQTHTLSWRTVGRFSSGSTQTALCASLWTPVPGATGYDITEGFLTGGGRQAIIKLIAMVPGNGLA